MLQIGSGFFWWFVVFNNYLLFIGYFTLVAITIFNAIYLYLQKYYTLGNTAGCPTATGTQVKVGVMPKKSVLNNNSYKS